LGAVNNG